jgi:hypothetical protein
MALEMPQFFKRKTPEKRLILHVGMPKCGTSTVQQTLAANRDTLLKKGIDYLNFGPYSLPDLTHVSTGNANPLAYAMYGYPQPHLSLQKVAAHLRELIAASTADTIILSHEDFVVFDAGRWKTFSSLLDRSVSEVLPVIHIREHTEWIASDFQQHIKQLRTGHPIDKHVGRRLRFLNFSEQCKKFESVFGEVRCRLIYSGMKITEDLLDMIGRPIDLASVQIDYNTGLSAEAVDVLLALNREKATGDIYSSALKDALASSKGKPKYRLPPELCNVVREFSKPDISALKAYLTEDEHALLLGAPIRGVKSSTGNRRSQ